MILFLASLINIIGYSNGVGLDQDIAIIAEELTELGHQVEFVHWLDYEPREKVDINIFLECAYPFFFPLATKNYLIPNPEWYNKPELIPQFDLILCKTKEAKRLFEPHTPNTVYLGFTSKDCYQEEKKELRSLIHLNGQSAQKGTSSLIDLWEKNPSLPRLHLLIHRKITYPDLPNVKKITEYLPEKQLRELQNRHHIHLCLSETEGFGHYISEALSTGAVVITTDAPPMNEFVTDKRCLVKASSTNPQNLATNYYFDQEHLILTLNHLLALTDQELLRIGEQNRERYLQNHQAFKQRLATHFGEVK